ncbi:MAG: hypothetical protein B2I17_07640 [Thermoplasmatales archaeon B_DKE]|nr:MAG: hypothetical protein B2I17_07640 [Thermoplasmatales archaeon B_DKE]
MGITLSIKSCKVTIRTNNLHCNYCQAEIREKPIIVETGSKNYYTCCPNCEKYLRKWRKMTEAESK